MIADKNGKDKVGRTALHMAISGSHQAAIDALLSAGRLPAPSCRRTAEFLEIIIPEKCVSKGFQNGLAAIQCTFLRTVMDASLQDEWTCKQLLKVGT